MNKIIKMGLIFLMLIIGSIGVYAGCHDGTYRENFTTSYGVGLENIQFNTSNMTRLDTLLNNTPIDDFIITITQNFTLTSQDSDSFVCKQQLPNQTSPGDDYSGGGYPELGECTLNYLSGNIACSGSRCTTPYLSYSLDKAIDNDWDTYFVMMGVMDDVQLEFMYSYPFDDLTGVNNITWNVKFMNETGNYTYNITLPWNCTNNITYDLDLIVKYIHPDYYEIGCFNGMTEEYIVFLSPPGITLGFGLFEQQVFWNVNRTIGGREMLDYRYINNDSVKLYNRSSGLEVGAGNFSVKDGYTYGSYYIQTDNVNYAGMLASAVYTRNFTAGGGLWNRDNLFGSSILYNNSNFVYGLDLDYDYNIDNNISSYWNITDPFIAAAAGNWTMWYSTYDKNCTNTLPTCTATIASASYNTTTNISLVITYSDSDGDPWIANQTRWYLGGVLQAAENNLTTLLAPNTAGSYLVSARVYDSYNWSIWCNDTFTITTTTTTTTTMSAASSCNSTRGIIFAGFALVAVIMIVVAAFGIISIFSGNFNVASLWAIAVGMVGFALTVVIGYVVIGNLSAITCAI